MWIIILIASTHYVLFARKSVADGPLILGLKVTRRETSRAGGLGNNYLQELLTLNYTNFVT